MPDFGIAQPGSAAGISVVLYHNPIAEVIQAVDQVLASPGNFHLVLVDNSQPAIKLPALDEQLVTVIQSPRNLGYGAGHNLAMTQTADRPYHFVLNADVQYGPEVLPALVAYLQSNPAVGLAMPKVVYPDGRTQFLCRLLPTPMDLFGRGFLPATTATAVRNDSYENRQWRYDRAAEFPFLSGCFMAVRRSVVDALGGFDERFFLYGEDLDLSRRIHAVARTMFFPDVTVVHEYRSEMRPSFRLLRLKIVNLGRYFWKWGWFFDRDRAAINQKTVADLPD